MSARTILAVAAVLASAPAVATADDTFEARAAGATAVARLDELVWALTAACDRGDEIAQRQCRLLRDARAAAYRGAPLLVEADPGAFVVGAWDAAKKSVTLQLSGCVRCAGIEVGGIRWYLTGGPARVEAGAVATPWLYDRAQPFSDEGAGKRWIQTLASARVHMVVKLAAQPRWQAGGKTGIGVDVLAWRVVTPCDGGVVIASPRSGPVAADRGACVEKR